MSPAVPVVVHEAPAAPEEAVAGTTSHIRQVQQQHQQQPQPPTAALTYDDPHLRTAHEHSCATRDILRRLGALD